LKTKLIAPALALASIAAAQNGNYSGLGVLSHGAGDIGAHSGEQLDLRLFASVNGIYDTGLQPFSLDTSGKLLQVNGLAGEEFALGAYGVHSWKRAQLGLDYRGSYRNYQGGSYYNGSDQTLRLGYSVQPTRKFTVDMRAIGGTSTVALAGPATNFAPTADSVVAQPTLLFFDSRTYYLESGLDANFLPTPRITITMGGSGYFVDHHANGLVNVQGYTLNGSLMRRLSRETVVGASYLHQHYDFPGNFGESDINVYTGRISHDFGRRWSSSLSAGAFTAEVAGLQTVSFDPVIAALLGVPSGIQAFHRKSIYPAGDARLQRKFRTSEMQLGYSVGVTPGNGVYLTSRQQSGYATFSYTGVRKWAFSIGGIYGKLSSIGQGIAPYTQKSGSAGATYTILKSVSAVARFDARDQSVDVHGYLRTSYRATLGFTFSPGTIPVSLW
jgi:hypothetical protein